MAQVGLVLGVSASVAREIVDAFDTFVAGPLEANLKKRQGRDLAKRNPMIYTVRGTTTTTEWIDLVLADKETSPVEGHLGTWQEEVARIVSGGFKPASGVDLQIDDGQTVRLYAIQAATNTKNAGGRKSDIESLKRCAAPLRAARRHVDLYVAVLHGRGKTRELRGEPGIHVLASDEFWKQVSGTADFRARLLKATIALADLMRKRSAEELARIRAEAVALFDDGQGNLRVDALANPPAGRSVATPKQLLLDDVEA